MNAEQWQIVSKAARSPDHIYGLERAFVFGLLQSGESRELDEQEALLLTDIGKRYGLVRWESQDERRSYERFRSNAKRGFLKGRRTPAGAQR